ncbi:MAG: 50S ribosomal protein L32e [Candidatus Nitrosocaldaceae archaeon]|nr:MAG: 50S ribosomal protein L32e [Candidatus Nitrosocaldaceae archaeon]
MSTDIKELLKLREEIKSKKPEFVACESWRYKRVKESWRKPRGIDNRMRRRLKGWPKLVKIGYGSPRVTRYLHPSGYNDVLVYNVDDLLKLDKTRDAARIGASVGRRKRIQILKKAKELNIKVLNP